VFGFETAVIGLELPKTAYAGGELIEGTLFLSIKKPVRSRGLSAALVAEQQFREQVYSDGEPWTCTSTRKIYDFRQLLDCGREYTIATDTPYPFSLVMPPVDLTARAAAGYPGSFQAGSSSTRTGPVPVGRPAWFVEGYLDVLPLEEEIRARIAIVQVPAAEPQPAIAPAPVCPGTADQKNPGIFFTAVRN